MYLQVLSQEFFKFWKFLQVFSTFKGEKIFFFQKCPIYPRNCKGIKSTVSAKFNQARVQAAPVTLLTLSCRWSIYQPPYFQTSMSCKNI